MVRIISGQLLNQSQGAEQQQINPSREMPMQESTQQQVMQGQNGIGRTLAGLGASAAQGIENTFSLPGQAVAYLGNKTGQLLTGNENFDLSQVGPQQSDEFKKVHAEMVNKGVKQDIAQGLGYTDLKPQSFAEDVGQGIFEDIIPILTTGPSALLSSAAGNVGAKLVAKAGFGPIAQLAAGLGSRLSANYLSKSGFGQLRKVAKQKMAENFNKFDRYADKTTVPASNLDETIETLKKQATANIPITSGRDKVIESLSDFARDINLGKAKLSDIRSAQQRIGGTLSDTFNPNARRLYKQAYGAFTNFIDDAVKPSPEAEQSWTSAKELYKGLNGTTALRDAIESSTNLKKLIESPILKFVIGGASAAAPKIISKGFSGLPGLAAGASKAAALAFGARTALRAADFWRNPETRKLYNEALESALFKDKLGLAASLKSLNQLASEIEKQEIKKGYQEESSDLYQFGI